MSFDTPLTRNSGFAAHSTSMTCLNKTVIDNFSFEAVFQSCLYDNVQETFVTSFPTWNIFFVTFVKSFKYLKTIKYINNFKDFKDFKDYGG
jgi:hypothetical protein